MTAVTLNQLATRGIDLYEICMNPNMSDHDMQKVLEHCRDHDTSSGSLKLSSKQRETLLGLYAVEMWSFPESSGKKDFDHCVRHKDGIENPHFSFARREACFVNPSHRYHVFADLSNAPAKLPKELECKAKLAMWKDFGMSFHWGHWERDGM